MFSCLNFISIDEDQRRHELTRSSFLIQSIRTKINRINGIDEPFISLSTIFLCRCLSFVIMLIFISLSTLNIILMLYIRLKLFELFQTIENDLIIDNALIIISMITSTISLIISVILDFIFDYIAIEITEFERHRFQSNFDASLTLKLFRKLIYKNKKKRIYFIQIVCFFSFFICQLLFISNLYCIC